MLRAVRVRSIDGDHAGPAKTNTAKENTMTEIIVVLYGQGGELDHKIITVFNDPDEALSRQIKEVIQTWILSPGDTIRIQEKT
jgi:hypothetical protein